MAYKIYVLHDHDTSRVVGRAHLTKEDARNERALIQHETGHYISVLTVPLTTKKRANYNKRAVKRLIANKISDNITETKEDK